MRSSDANRAGRADVLDTGYRDRVLRARAQEPGQKLLAGFQLFTRGLELTKLDEVRRIGTADEGALTAALHRRFDRVRRVREAGLYHPVAPSVEHDGRE